MSDDGHVDREALGADERRDEAPKNEADEEMRSFLSELHDGGKINAPTTVSRGQAGVFNTGVKGVLTDHKFAKQEAQQRMAAEREEQLKAMNKNSYDLAKDQQQEKDEFDLLLEEEDDEVMRSIREARLKELQRMGQVERSAAQLPFESLITKKKYGKVFDLIRDSFVDAIDKEPSSVAVVIHLYQPYIAACTKINSCLAAIAQKYPTSKFCRIKSTDAKAAFDEVGLPVVLVYKGGELMQSFVRVHEDLPKHFDVDDFEGFLIENRIVSPADAVNMD